jgi:SPX domain protein involved in polyphosphate accumulation
MKQIKYRHELKHYINMSDYLAIRNRVKHIMSVDRNADESNEYKIRSLYFDNLNDKALMEKLNGISKREKFRIRFYNDDHTFIRLEKKMKHNSLCAKLSEKISKEECISLLNGDITFLRDSEKALFIELYSKMKEQLLRPKTIVDYTREAYVYKLGNVRVTFDKQIKSGLYNKNLFEENLPTVQPIDNRFIVLEVKFDEFLPEIIQDIIQTNERKATAISKYAAARIYG